VLLLYDLAVAVFHHDCFLFTMLHQGGIPFDISEQNSRKLTMLGHGKRRDKLNQYFVNRLIPLAFGTLTEMLLPARPAAIRNKK
jgi:hypothetical protein